MFFVNPDPFLVPSYRMSPFMTTSIAANNQLPENDFAIHYLNTKFGKENWKFTQNGRHAIAEALNNYSLSKTDIITVLTTSQNLYISSCVTKTIEEFCQWNREIIPETKVILVNHEFGFPYQNMEALVSLGIPIIEDCCTTFFSQDENQKIGKYGDFSVFSLPKFFPIQIGGILVSKKNILDENQLVTPAIYNYMLKVLSNQLEKDKHLLEKRAENYHYALSKFESLGFEARFHNNHLIVPYALLLKNNGILKNLNQWKDFLNKNGIHNSVFYGEDAFFIANHQSLSLTDIDFMYECMVQFIANN
ncbi:MAG: DegT/DnrJ/EryC1/StrS family aminotransferase [Bacteroidetes bacterium]|uniref:DegT/DnrJ/EryC1/StrS family aminotransferase n=1 Tax=Flavobacterium sp. TaxID=239 RepID=UPI002FDAF4F3|nr:DegT/DnrJ/EryC1/StrS family aminotransferase [Bacteroidota bacterium]